MKLYHVTFESFHGQKIQRTCSCGVKATANTRAAAKGNVRAAHERKDIWAPVMHADIVWKRTWKSI